jgi:hypothetical protein
MIAFSFCSILRGVDIVPQKEDVASDRELFAQIPFESGAGYFHAAEIDVIAKINRRPIRLGPHPLEKHRAGGRLTFGEGRARAVAFGFWDAGLFRNSKDKKRCQSRCGQHPITRSPRRGNYKPAADSRHRIVRMYRWLSRGFRPSR